MTLDELTRYCQTAVRNAGVPDLWLEDATQDVLFGLWRRGVLAGPRPYRVRAVRYEAVDAARRYGLRSRRGANRHTEPLLWAEGIPAPDAMVAVERRLDAGQAIRRLDGREAAIVRAWGRGWPLWRIGRALGISESRAAALNRAALRHARALVA